MKHTECGDCKLREGDCGYHLMIDGNKYLDIASLSACDKYGNCMFFKPKANPQDELISREWLEDAFDNLCCHNCKMCRNFRIEDSFYKCALIDNAPTVTPEKALMDKLKGGEEE